MPTIYAPAADDKEVAGLVSDRLHLPPLAGWLKLDSPLVSAKSLQDFSPTHSLSPSLRLAMSNVPRASSSPDPHLIRRRKTKD